MHDGAGSQGRPLAHAFAGSGSGGSSLGSLLAATSAASALNKNLAAQMAGIAALSAVGRVNLAPALAIQQAVAASGMADKERWARIAATVTLPSFAKVALVPTIDLSPLLAQISVQASAAASISTIMAALRPTVGKQFEALRTLPA